MSKSTQRTPGQIQYRNPSITACHSHARSPLYRGLTTDDIAALIIRIVDHLRLSPFKLPLNHTHFLFQTIFLRAVVGAFAEHKFFYNPNKRRSAELIVWDFHLNFTVSNSIGLSCRLRPYYPVRFIINNKCSDNAPGKTLAVTPKFSWAQFKRS